MKTTIDFAKKRYIFFGISICLIIAGIIACAVKGVRLDIEFSGGSVVEYNYAGEIEEGKVDQLASEALGKEVKVQKTTNIADGSQKLVVSVAGHEALSSDEFIQLTKALNDGYPDHNFEVFTSDLVSPSIGREMLLNGLLAMVIASVLIVAFVWFSFRKMSGPSAGVMALVALAHDITISTIAFVLMGGALNETLIAVILTILGFSINDTIVVYDRIRENMALSKESMPLDDLVSLSINQSLTRTINTSICMFVSVAIAYVYAVLYNLDSIKEFALPMLVGILSGTYSSVFIASPLWLTWKTRGSRTGYER